MRKVKFLSKKSLQIENMKVLGCVLFSMNQKTLIVKLLIQRTPNLGPFLSRKELNDSRKMVKNA